MATPVWQAGTIYSPGSLVRPVSTASPTQTPVTNGNFEAGNSGWTLDTGFSIVQDGVSFDGTWALKFDQTAEQSAINTASVAVLPGQTINGSCQVQAGSSCGARCEIAWYDASDELISSSAGSEVKNAGAAWMQSTVNGVAPAGAAHARFAVTAFRVSGTRTPHIDQCVWDAVPASAPTGLIFRAVQALAGYSGSSEPVWPIVNGATVVDNEVTWEAVFGSRITWEASPVLVSGDYEPTWPTVPDGTVADGTIKWVAMNFRVQDAKCPNSKAVAIAASKIFAADDDIIAFSATVNPLDWSSPQDAGYIPFGLNSYGSTPVTALGLYRSNLVAFNSEAYQMWQVDQDPANMAILDASPVACLFPKSVQPVSNDLVMCTPEGVRNIGIAGASTNLQAGYFGAQIDPLVLAKIQADEIPFALFWPATGQYWLVFGDEAFVLTMNGGAKDQSWSRYTFPEDLTDWAILDGDLYLRAGDLVWRVDPAELNDDAYDVFDTGLCSDIWHSEIACATVRPPINLDNGVYTFSSTQSYEDRVVIADDTAEFPLEMSFPYDITEAPASGTTLYLWYSEENFQSNPVFIELTGSTGTVAFTRNDTGFFAWGVTTDLVSPSIMTSGTVEISCTPDVVSTPFEGYIAWPYLDFGLLGVDKMLEGFDIVADGTFSISFGYSQRDFSLATDPYPLDGDTLPGSMVPMPLTGPSFQLRITFDGSQSWQWFATNLYCNNMGIG